mmetsp:Transcript_105114/g.296025  ORF Transcript_105114/g.296025 Transcript_105114/m.296025 type:complete len:196 (-) Transcript_105114:45-632(-)
MGAALAKTPCGSLEHVLVEQVLGWLTPIDQDFGPFSVQLLAASHDDSGGGSAIDMKEFSLEGLGLHGSVSADLPMVGKQTLPLNLDMDLQKSMEDKGCEVQVRDFNFDQVDEDDAKPVVHGMDVESRDFDLSSAQDMLGNFGGMMSDVVGGGGGDALKQVLNMDQIKGWVCERVSEVINQQIAERTGVSMDSDED